MNWEIIIVLWQDRTIFRLALKCRTNKCWLKYHKTYNQALWEGTQPVHRSMAHRVLPVLWVCVHVEEQGLRQLTNFFFFGGPAYNMWIVKNISDTINNKTDIFVMSRDSRWIQCLLAWCLLCWRDDIYIILNCLFHITVTVCLHIKLDEPEIFSSINEH